MSHGGIPSVPEKDSVLQLLGAGLFFISSHRGWQREGLSPLDISEGSCWILSGFCSLKNLLNTTF